MNDIVSVVVPVYNTERFLNRCIESIVGQSYKDLEIILVDDGSSDSCHQICDEWAEKDRRIKVVHKENAGLGMARNTGIENATGKYICFFDSDDYISCELVEECYRAAEEHGADMVCFGHDTRLPNGEVVRVSIPAPSKYEFFGEEVKRFLLPMSLADDSADGESWKLQLSAWNRLYSMDVIRHSGWRFVSERDVISEDFYSLTELHQYINKAVIINKVLYHYTVNVHSLSRSYREDRYVRLKYFHEAMTGLSVRMSCCDVLAASINTVFLGQVIGSIKQIVAADMSFGKRYEALKAVIDDELLQRVLSELDYSGENLQKKVLFLSMKCRMVLLCFCIVASKNMIKKY